MTAQLNANSLLLGDWEKDPSDPAVDPGPLIGESLGSLPQPYRAVPTSSQ